MQYITVFDYLLLPVYLYVFYLIVKSRSVKYTDPEIRKYYFTSFYLHMFGSVAYAMMVQYYYGYGDSFTFYYGGNFFTSQILENSSNVKYFFKPAAEIKTWFDAEVSDLSVSGYFGIESNVSIMKISALLAALSFNKYLIIGLFFGFFSFAGLWRLFLVFKDINQGKQTRLMAWTVLYMPSIWFWGSGLIKDSLCIGCTGFIVYFVYKLFIKKEFSITAILATVLLVYALGVIKSYILIVLTLGLAVFIFYRFITPFKNLVIRSFIILIFLGGIMVIAFITNFTDQMQLLAEESMVQVESFQRNYIAVEDTDERSRGNLKFREIDVSLGGMISQSPVAVFNCLFRPFIWESRKIFILLSSLEALLMLISTVYILIRLKFFGFFKEIFSNPFYLVSFITAIFFALIIGFTTYNFGTMARYKIILLPFYFFTLVSLYSVAEEKSRKQNNLPGL